MQVRIYSLYRHTFPNGKMYIGITKKTPVGRRWQNGKGYSHQPKMAHAITKYGWANVRHDVLLVGLTEQEAKFWEQFYIKQFDTVENGYNITFGGDGLTGVKRSEATKRKIGEANRQKNYPGNPEVLKEYVSQHGGRKTAAGYEWRYANASV